MSDDKLSNNTASYLPVLFQPADVDIVVNGDSGDLWLAHGKPVDLDLEGAFFNPENGILHFTTKTGETFEMGVVIRDDMRPKVAMAERVTMIYTSNNEIHNMIFLPLTVSRE